MSDAETSQPKRLKLSQGEEQADSEQIYSPYYTANLQFILNSVLSKDSVDKNALKEDEICSILELKQLEETAQQLFIRLFLRKHQWMLVSRIKYPKIASDLKPILAVLVESGFLQDERNLNELPLILDLMPAEDLKLLCKNFKVSYPSSKQKAVEALIKHSSSFKPIFGSKSTGSILLTKAKSQLGSCVRVADGVRQALHKAILLFSLPILAFEDMSEPQSVIYRLLQVNIGSVVFPSYPIVMTRPLFQSSEHYDRFYAAYCTEQSLLSAIEQKNDKEVESIMKSTLEKFHTILGLELNSCLITKNSVCIDLTTDDPPKKDVETVAKTSHKDASLFKRYSDGSVYTRILSSCVEHLEKCRRYEHANELLEILLSQSTYCVHSRGRWWERLALNLDQHLKKYNESVDVIVKAMSDPSVRPSRRLSLMQRAQRLRKHVKTVANNKIRRLPEIDFISAPVKEVKAKMHPCREAGVKSHFIMSEGEDTTSIFLSVEYLAISHYKETEGWTHAVHAEGATFATVYGLLFWDIVFGAEVPDVFRNIFQVARNSRDNRYGIIMQTGGHFSDGTRYGTDEIVAFAGGGAKHGAIGEAFLDSSVAHSLRRMVPGKRVLDIGCGVGDWCCLAAHYGAQTVHGFDIQEEMVELAKQATSHLDMVHIQVGDAANMPYDDASFDVAISLYVTCNLSPEVFEKHFQEVHRVLVPGGKAIIQIPTDWSHSGLYTKFEADSSIVENEIAQILKMVPRHPTTAQVTEAFKNADDILVACFAVDAKGSLFHVKNINQVKHGQPIWRKTEVMTFPNFFYSDKSNITHMLTTGFHIDSIENYFTEERRVAYNNKKPNIPLKKEYIENPLVLVYYISKPLHS